MLTVITKIKSLCFTGMILIITHKLDFTADFLINQLNKREILYHRLNCEDLLVNPKYIIDTDFGLEVLFKNLPQIKSVWFRRTQVPFFPKLSIQEQFYFDREFNALLDNIACSLDNKRWLSYPFTVRKAENKILQLRTAKTVGFSIPKTLITNDKEKLRLFYAGNLKTITKPLYSGRIPDNEDYSIFFTSEITQMVMDNLEGYDLTPCLYQEYIEKLYEIRITIIGQEVFAVKIDSQSSCDTKTDWRKGRPSLTVYQLPRDIRAMCIAICEKLDLKFGAIDMIKTRNSDYVFLEINPNGQWAWVEIETGLPICNAIINYLNNDSTER